MDERQQKKNIKISEKHHSLLKEYANGKGMKVYRIIEKWVDEYCKPKRRDLYGE